MHNNDLGVNKSQIKSLYAQAINLAQQMEPHNEFLAKNLDQHVNAVGLDIIDLDQNEAYDNVVKELAEKLGNKLSIQQNNPYFQVVLKAANAFQKVKQETSSFHIEPPPAFKIENGLPPIAPYTLLTHSIRSASELGKLAEIFPKRALRDLVTVKPERIVLQQMAARLPFEVCLKGENTDTEIKTLSPSLAKEFMDGQASFSKRMMEFRDKTQNEIYQYLTGKTQVLSEDTKILVEELKKEASRLDNEALLVISQRAADVVYVKTARKELQNYPIFKSKTLEGYSPIPMQTKSESRVFMVNGGIASGKGSTEGKIKDSLSKEGINWSSVVKLNKDSFKPILLNPSELSRDNALFYSGLVHDEASVIHDLIFSEYQRRLKNNEPVPHLYIDRVLPTTEFLSLAGQLDKGMDLYMVQIPVEKSISMAYIRGQKTGRYETTNGILTSHKQVPLELEKTLQKIVAEQGKNNIRYYLMANISLGKVKKVAEINFKTKTIKLKPCAEEYISEFYKKSTINAKALSLNELYASGDNKTELGAAHLAHLKNIMNSTPLAA